MKKLDLIQKIAQISAIVCKVLKIITLVGGICALVAIPIVIATREFLAPDSSVYEILSSFVELEESEWEQLHTSAIPAMIAGAVSCFAQTYLFAIASNYLNKELSDGTPFTFDGAVILRKVAIRSIIVLLASNIVCGIILAIFKLEEGIAVGIDGSLMVGALLLAMSYVFEYGAELRGNNHN